MVIFLYVLPKYSKQGLFNNLHIGRRFVLRMGYPPAPRGLDRSACRVTTRGTTTSSTDCALEPLRTSRRNYTWTPQTASGLVDTELCDRFALVKPCWIICIIEPVFLSSMCKTYFYKPSSPHHYVFLVIQSFQVVSFGSGDVSTNQPYNHFCMAY